MVALNNNVGLDGYLIVDCRVCGDTYKVYVNSRDYKDWTDGKGLIQDILYYLTNDDRELLLTKTCGKCFDKMFEDNHE